MAILFNIIEVVDFKQFLSLFYLVFSAESSHKPEKEEAHLYHSPDSSFSNSPDPAKVGQENHQGE